MSAFVATVFAFGLSSSPGAPLTDVATIVARHLDAIGGAARLRAVSTVREVGTMTMIDATSSTGAALTEEKRPNMFRSERTIQGVPIVWGFDGVTAWTRRGAGEPEILVGERAKGIAANEFDHFLLDYSARNIVVVLAGVEEVESKPAYKLKVTLRDGAIRYSYIDAASFLEVRRDYPEKDGTMSRQMFRGHKVFDGVTRPTIFETTYPSSGRRAIVAVERIELNPPIDGSRFRMPRD
jgi:hypothetical protein